MSLENLRAIDNIVPFTLMCMGCQTKKNNILSD